MNSRRRFLKIGGLALAGGFMFGGKNIFSQTVKGGDYFPVPTDALGDSAALLRYETFEPLINTSFEIKTERSNETIENKQSNKFLRLIEVVKHTYGENQRSRVFSAGFTLIFQLETTEPLADAIYEVSHPQTGEFALFISTVGRSGRKYQIVFNRVYI